MSMPSAGFCVFGGRACGAISFNVSATMPEIRECDFTAATAPTLARDEWFVVGGAWCHSFARNRTVLLLHNVLCGGSPLTWLACVRKYAFCNHLFDMHRTTSKYVVHLSWPLTKTFTPVPPHMFIARDAGGGKDNF